MLSITTITGISQPQTLKILGYIKNTKVTILIDNGSSHNFMDTRIAKKLNMFMYPTFDLQVSILGNKTTSCNGKCHKVELAISDYKLKLLIYAMGIGGVDVILGSQWLATPSTMGLNLQKNVYKIF